jgi:hypothetical protein
MRTRVAWPPYLDDRTPFTDVAVLSDAFFSELARFLSLTWFRQQVMANEMFDGTKELSAAMLLRVPSYTRYVYLACEFVVTAIGIRKCLQKKIGKGVFVMANDGDSTISSGKRRSSGIAFGLLKRD